MDFDEWLQRLQEDAREALEILARTPADAREAMILRREKLNRLLEAMDSLQEYLAGSLDEGKWVRNG